MSNVGQEGEDFWFKAFKEGSESALDTILGLYSRRMFRYAFSLLRDKEEAEDAVMITFSKLWHERESIKNAGHLQEWLRLVTTRTAIDLLRAKKINAVELDERLIEKPDIISNAALIREQLLGLIDREVAKLPEKVRDAFIMRYFRQMEYPDIAAALNMTVDSASTYASRAMVKIRMNLADKSLELVCLVFLLVIRSLYCFGPFL